MDDFRRADAIELYDARVIVYRGDCDRLNVTWREFPEDGETLYVDGRGLDRILRVIGVDPETWFVQTHPKGKNSGRWETLKDSNLPLIRGSYIVIGHGDMVQGEGTDKIIDLYAKVEGTELLQIRYTTGWDDEGEPQEEERTVTYCGRFGVWWAGE